MSQSGLEFYQTLADQSEQALLCCAWAMSETHNLDAMAQILKTLAKDNTGEIFTELSGVEVRGFNRLKQPVSDRASVTFQSAFANALRPMTPSTRQNEVAWIPAQQELFDNLLKVMDSSNGLKRLLHEGVKCVRDPRFFDHLVLQNKSAMEPCLLKAVSHANTAALLAMLKHCSDSEVVDFASDLTVIDEKTKTIRLTEFSKALDFSAPSKKGGLMEFLQTLDDRAGLEKSLPIRMILMADLIASKWAWEAHDLPTLQSLASLGGLDPSHEMMTKAMQRYVAKQQQTSFHTNLSINPTDPCMRLAVVAASHCCAPVLEIASPLLTAGANRMGLMDEVLKPQGAIDPDRHRHTLAVLMRHGESLDARLKSRHGMDRQAALVTLTRMGHHPGSDVKLLNLLELGADTAVILKPGRTNPFKSNATQFETHVKNIVHAFEARKVARQTMADFELDMKSLAP